MKNIVLSLALLLFAGTALGQKGKLAQAVSAYNSGKYPDAVKLLNAASEHEKTMNDPKVYVYKALAISNGLFSGLYPDAGFEYNAALDAALKAKELGGDEKYSQELADAFDVILGGIHNNGVVAYNAGDFNLAIEHFNSKSDAYERMGSTEIDTSLILLKGIAYQQVDDMPNAVVYYEKLADMEYPDENVYRFLLSQYKEVDDAKYLALLDKAKGLYPENNNYALLELDYYIQRGEMDEKLAEMEALANDNPENISLLMNIGMVHEQKENYTAALEWYDKILALDPTHKQALFGSGASYFNQAVAVQGEIDYLNYGEESKEAELKKKRDGLVDQAYPYFEKVYQLDPDYPQVLQAFVEFYKMKGDLAKSKEFEAKVNSLN